MRMCFTAFLRTSHISKRKCQKFLAAIKAGQLEPPEDGRSQRQERDNPKRDHARLFFQFLYDHLAEPIAEGDPEPTEEEDSLIVDEFNYWVRGEAAENPVASASSSLQSGLPQKFLVNYWSLFYAANVMYISFF